MATMNTSADQEYYTSVSKKDRERGEKMEKNTETM